MSTELNARRKTNKMKITLVTLVSLAAATAAFAELNPSLPMVTGSGNVITHPVHSVVTNQTAASQAAGTDQASITLEKFVVTGSLIPPQATRSGKKTVNSKRSDLQKRP
jgi:hypothetical protein